MTRPVNPNYFSDREALQGEIRRLGLRLELEPRMREVFTPCAIGPRRVGNRFLLHPMEGADGTLDGRPDELTFHRWGRFARGGAKLLWGEAVAVHPEGRGNTRQLLFCEANLAALEKLLAFARAEHRAAWGSDADFLVGLQLTHSGRFAYPRPVLLFREALADAQTRCGCERGPLPPDYPTANDDFLDRLQDDYVRAARWCRQLGCDFVDLKQCHRYLLSELLAAKGRPGKYGGSLENRTRFVRELLRRIREECGPDLILATRMNIFDSLPFAPQARTGIGEPRPAPRPYLHAFGSNPDDPLLPDLTEPLAAVRLYRAAGLQLLNVSLGCPYWNPHLGRPADTPPPDGYLSPEPPLAGVARHFDLCARIQEAFPDLPVAGTGYSYLRQYLAEAAEANLRARRVTLAGVGRGALAYPDFVRDLTTTGRLEPRKVCLTVSWCTALLRAKGNELGQYAAGCVPRDRVYARLFQEAQRRTRKAPAPEQDSTGARTAP